MAKVSIALVGSNFYLCGPNGTNSAAGSPEFRRTFEHRSRDIHHAYVALGEDNSYFLRYYNQRTREYRSTWSLPAYPGLDRHLSENAQGDPLCVSLGEDGHYFMRGDRGSAWNLPAQAEEFLESRPSDDPVVKLWLGKDDAYYAETRGGRAEWNMQGNYGSLAQELKYDNAGVRALGMNLQDNASYFVLFKDMRAQGNAGRVRNVLTREDFMSWVNRLNNQLT
ncbi:hypothetical protein GGR56DRAFT_617389 [Xylariaceae sp. FL0804]|nr:hypothetical protein GGR56DRAFT_617389 [Xylariaceae sp. FL0804]